MIETIIFHKINLTNKNKREDSRQDRTGILIKAKKSGEEKETW